MSDLNDSTLAFDKKKQAAILGWMLRDKLFFLQSETSLRPEMFVDPYVNKLVGYAFKLFKEFSHPPTSVQELKQYRPVTQEEARTQVKLEETLNEALECSKIFSLDVLRSEITGWMHATIFHQGFQRAADQYNAFKVKDAFRTLEDVLLKKSTATFEDGVNSGFISSAERIRDESKERIEQGKSVLSYGIQYLDDALGGIAPNDLIVLGAKAGQGKTQMAMNIALANAQNGVPVHYFALEAEDREIERRIKYGKLSDLYYKSRALDQEKNVEQISYTDWRLAKKEHVLHRFETPEFHQSMQESLKNLHTIYNTIGIFDLNDLEKSLLKIVTETKLIIIDHLHYVDTDDQLGELASYKAITKLVRKIVLRYHVPVILIAHLRKNQNSRSAVLINGIEDFHGTSDVFKIATTCIMMAPSHDQPKEGYKWPTYMGVVKSRLDGNRTYYTALTNYNYHTSKYTPDYILGKMKVMNTEWNELDPKDVPYWAKNNNFNILTNSNR